MRWIQIVCMAMAVLSYGLCQGQSGSDDYAQSLREINKRINIAYEENNFNALAQGYYDRAEHNFDYHLNHRDVIDDLISSATIFRRMNEESGFYKSRLLLAKFYIEQEIFLDEAIKLTEEAYTYYKSSFDEWMEAQSVSQLGQAYQKKLDYEKAIYYVEEGLKKSIKLNDIDMELTNRLLITQLLGNLGNVEKVLEQGKFILHKERKNGLNKVTPHVYHIMGSTLLMDDQIDSALIYLEKAVRENKLDNDLAYQSNVILAKAYNALDSTAQAYARLLDAGAISQRLYKKEKYAMANQSAVKYQAFEKDQEIRALEEDKLQYAFKLTQRTRLFLIISSILALTALAAYNYYRLQRQRFQMDRLLSSQKEEIALQKINELENSLKIENLQSMVIGQEAERSRIAQDLHDSLGGMLSTLKLQYDTLQIDHKELTSDEAYNRILNMIDSACNEVRDIARNLKPISLEKIGLTAALRDLVNRYTIKGVMDISLHTHDIDGILSTEAKLHVYRIIQELLNNALKHAQASEIDVQINRMDGQLFIVVEDNGRGFDVSNAQQGLGLGNLQSRVNVLRGEMEIDSDLDKGTSITVHIPLSSAQFALSTSLP